ncbi:DNA gyrase inhibitor YacG [Rhizosaccharibacter radicis]|uniref:DNA gyrase inhibitor YacG n=1 Tax=Rhizosaccharibacter radicis TaxID=2782605 RepID=A0ABT1VW60_9PROT|nr:DNA gyrase inhibitor YacG [Acetobacteraceae bacterium KSS12]
MTSTPSQSSTCPICGRPTCQETRPFCSRRCADIDLGRWFSGHYAMPGPAVDTEHAGDRDGGEET